jgi:uncharacterized protein YkwD
MSAVLVNRERVSRGIAALGWDDQLAAKAQAWAEQMAAQNTISHSNLPSGITESWTTLGENVGFGNDIRVVHIGFMNSPVHRDAILGTQYTAIGVGVAVRGNRVFVAQEFKG